MATSQPTVLLVDDEPSILAAIKRQLRDEGYRILTTEDPTEVLSMLDNEGVDVLISDVNMPEMSGLDLITQVRARFPAVTRILLTGQTSIDVAVEAINRGEVFRYLQKPWAEGDVRDATRRAVRLAATQRRRLAIEAAAAHRAALLDLVEREHPEIFRVERSDGLYVLPDLTPPNGEATIASPAVAVLEELAREPTPSMPGPLGAPPPRFRRSAPSIPETTGVPARTTKRWEDSGPDTGEVTDPAPPPIGEPSMEATTLPRSPRLAAATDPGAQQDEAPSSPEEVGDLQKPRGGAALLGGLAGAAAVMLVGALYLWGRGTPAPVAPPPTTAPIVSAAPPPLLDAGTTAAPVSSTLASAVPVTAPTGTTRALSGPAPGRSTKVPPAPSATSTGMGDLKVPNWK